MPVGWNVGFTWKFPIAVYVCTVGNFPCYICSLLCSCVAQVWDWRRKFHAVRDDIEVPLYCCYFHIFCHSCSVKYGTTKGLFLVLYIIDRDILLQTHPSLLSLEQLKTEWLQLQRPVLPLSLNTCIFLLLNWFPRNSLSLSPTSCFTLYSRSCTRWVQFGVE